MFLMLLMVWSGGCDTPPSRSIELRFWAIGSEADAIGPLIEKFEALHPEIRVIVQQIPWSAAHEKLLTAFAGQSTPDLCQLGNTWIPEFATLDALVDLGPYLATSEISPQFFFPGIWATNMMRGSPFGIPWYVDTRVLFYRRDLLEAAGFHAPPRTWTEWTSAMSRIQDQLPHGSHALLMPTNEWEPLIILGLQGNEPLLRENDCRGNFRSAAFRRAFDFYRHCFDAGFAPKIQTTEIANVWQALNAGQFAMYVTGPWNIGEFRKRFDRDQLANWATSPLPAPVSEGVGVSMAGGCSLSIFRGSPHVNEAWKLIEFLSATPQQVEFHHLTGNLPARLQAWDEADDLRDPLVEAFRTQLEQVAATPRVPEWEQIATRVYEFAELSVRGKIEPGEALRRLDEEVDRVLAKRRWMLAREDSRR